MAHIRPAMRILLVTHYYPAHRGGVETVAQRLAQALAADAGMTIEWMASDCDAPPAGMRCLPARSWNGIERRTGLPYPLWSPAALRALREAVSSCDVVHLHESLYMGNAFASHFAARCRKPVVLTQHIGAIPYDERILRGALSLANRTLARRALSRASRVVFVSPAVQSYFAAFCAFRAPPLYVPNGVDASLFAFADHAQMAAARRAAGRDPGRALCAFVGRFVPRKGLPIVMALARQLPDVDWILAGDGPLRPEADGLPNVSVVRGRSGADIAAIYRMADLLILPSKGEGFPLVVQEAMASGTPALVGRETAEGCPAAKPFLLTEDVAGPDVAQAWARRVAELLRERGALGGMRAEVARVARANWSWTAAAQAYGAVFRELAASSAR